MSKKIKSNIRKFTFSGRFFFSHIHSVSLIMLIIYIKHIQTIYIGLDRRGDQRVYVMFGYFVLETELLAHINNIFYVRL